MKYQTYSHRNGETILNDSAHESVYHEVLDVIDSITDEELKAQHMSYERRPMSLSRAINDVLKGKFAAKGWLPEAPIFQDEEYLDKRWRLDFAKTPISIEVAFNHGEAIAWNLLKPVMAGDMNYVKKAIKTDAAIVIAATAELKDAGAFDSAVGEYEKVLRYLKPLHNILTAPLVVIGLGAPKTFRLEKEESGGKTKTSRIVEIG